VLSALQSLNQWEAQLKAALEQTARENHIDWCPSVAAVNRALLRLIERKPELLESLAGEK